MKLTKIFFELQRSSILVAITAGVLSSPALAFQWPIDLRAPQSVAFNAPPASSLKCLSFGKDPIQMNAEQVLLWKTTTKNGFKERGYVKGKVTDLYARSRNSRGGSHTRFAIDIDDAPGGDIEMVFNDEFGPLPNIQIGTMVTACGVYITANERSNLPSPNGAIIHWLHYNPGDRDGGVHPDGFVIYQNRAYGYTPPDRN